MKLEADGENFLIRITSEDLASELSLGQQLEDFYGALDLAKVKHREITLDLSRLPRVNSDLISKFVLLHNELAKNSTQIRIVCKKNLKPPFDVVMLQKIISIEYID